MRLIPSVGLLVCVVACGGAEPSAPTANALATSSLPLRVGTYRLTLRSPAADAAFIFESPCGPAFLPFGNLVVTSLDLAFEAGAWVGRSTASGGDLRITFRDGPPLNSGMLPVTGTLTGTAIDLFISSVIGFPSSPYRVTLGDANGATVSIDAEASLSSAFIRGHVMGPMQFAGDGATSTCTSGEWSILPAP